jgi:hypothetical protein
MWWWTAIALANPASPDAAFFRRDDALAARRYAKISEGHGPAHARGRGGGDYQTWTFRDGVVERYQRFKGSRLIETGDFDAYGQRVATVTYGAAVPAQVVVAGHQPHPVDVSSWVEHKLAAPAAPGARHGSTLLLRVPAAPDGSPAEGAPPGPAVWTLPEGIFRASMAPEADVFSDSFRDGLLAGCGCTVVDRSTAWIGGRVGARYLLDVPDAGAMRVGEVWAVPFPGGTLVAGFSAPRADADPLGTSDLGAPLAVGRAIVAMARWETP